MPVYADVEEKFEVCIIDVVPSRNPCDSDGDKRDAGNDCILDHDGEEVISLSIDGDELRILRWYLTLTACLIPRSKTWTYPSMFAQFVVLCGLCVTYAYDLGAFGDRTLVDEELTHTLAAVKNACWSLRFVLLYAIGLIYFRKRHLEKMLSGLTLTREYWGKAQKTIQRIMIAIVLFVFVLPITLRLFQMDLKTKHQTVFPQHTIVLNATLAFLSRFFAMPMFVAFVHVLYLLFTKIRLYKRQLRRWKREFKKEARDQFVDIMTLIRNAERVFQTFLIVQVGMLLVVLLPAVLSFAQRINTEGHYSVFYVYPSPMKKAAARLPNDERGIISLTNIAQSNKSVLLYVPAETVPNVTENQQQEMKFVPEVQKKEMVDKWAIVKVIANALGIFFEMLVLSSLPLFLLAKVSKVMAQLPDTVGMMKFSEQEEQGYMIQNKDALAEVLEYLKLGRGFQVLGMDLTTVKVALVTLVTPFFTTVIHLMMVRVDIAN